MKVGKLKQRVEKRIGSSTLWMETGELAKQAAGSCLIGYGETVVLSATATGPPRPGIDFFPLTCDYRERVAAAGKFPGGFLKREGRPTTKETLTARLIDRPIRPSFPDWFHDEVQIQAFVMASDRQSDGDVLAMNGASASLLLAPLPFQGPIGSVRLGYIAGEFVPFPTQDELEESDLDLIVSGTKDVVLMIEGFARELPEALMAEAITTAHGFIREICELQEELVAKVQPVKKEYVVPEPDTLLDSLAGKYMAALKEAQRTEGKQARAEAVALLKERVVAETIPDPLAEGAVAAAALDKAWHDLERRAVRELILAGTRPDGRGAKALRQIDCKVDLLPRVHGSAVFQRGETQVLNVLTLGMPRMDQLLDTLGLQTKKRYMHHYNMPPYANGETGRMGGTKRREVGHGMLAERALLPLVPSLEEFPYALRLVSEVMSSNGSTSMADCRLARLPET